HNIWPHSEIRAQELSGLCPGMGRAKEGDEVRLVGTRDMNKGDTSTMVEGNPGGPRPYWNTARPSRFKERTMSTSELIGSSPQFVTALEDVKTVAAVDCVVLIRGETGTGKEVIARAIHDASARRQHRFVAINCAAIPAALLESEFFGYERGAFTGAMSQRTGRFEAAHRGTLFLDEIGELPIELQPKLLRAIQEQQFERLGSSQPTRVDVRIVAATNQN